MSRLKAFTMVELLVVMVLSGILVGLAFLMFQIIQQQFVTYQTSGNSALTSDNIQRLIQYDFQYADLVKTNNNQLICQHTDRTIHYLFEEQNIIRWLENRDLPEDTFKINTKDLTCFFNNKPIENGVVNKCSVNIRYSNSWLTIHQHKTYSAQQLMSLQ